MMANVRSVISADYSRRNLSLSKEPTMTPTGKQQLNDPDIHKGAIEGDRPSDEQQGNPNGTGINDAGLPDDPIATAEDEEGANLDRTQG
jgi:hypothetical protein